MPHNKLELHNEEYIHLFSALFQNDSLGILVINKDGEIVMANDYLLTLFEYPSPKDIIGEKVEILIPQRFRQHHVSDRNHFIEKPAKRPMGIGRDLFGRKKTGLEFPVEISLSGYNKNNEIFVIAFISDISKRKEIEASVYNQQIELAEINKKIESLNQELESKVHLRTRQLQNTMKELEASRDELAKALSKEKELSDMKGRFVTMASHEFRTPLTTILSSASLLSKYSLTEEQEKRNKHIERIKSSVNNLIDILNEFLSIGKIEDGKITPNKTHFNINEMIASLCNEMKDIVKPGQKLIYEHKGNETVFLDQSLLKNILINLISNAIKFSPENSNIILKTEVNDQQIIISLQDNGIGISEADQAHLFERFYRGSNVTNIQGTGLGLHIVKKYIEIMGGNITIKSSLDSGTHITLNFQL